VVDFKSDDSIEILESNLSSALSKLRDCEEIAFLTDLSGGSPFKSSVMLSLSEKEEKSFVISGANLGMLLEVSMSKDTYNIEDLKQLALELGKSSIKIFETKIRKMRIMRVYKLELFNYENSN
jgi:PTS system N-acetylgalactosamine-specific IIA component